MLGATRALQAGIVLILAYVFAAYLCTRVTVLGPLAEIAEVFGGESALGLGAHLKTILVGLVGPAAMVACLYALGRLAARGSAAEVVFMTGIALFPAAVGSVALALLYGSLPELGVGLAAYFGMLGVLILNGGMKDVQGFSERGALFLSPAVFCAMASASLVVGKLLIET
jgi:hypothetical protein